MNLSTTEIIVIGAALGVFLAFLIASSRGRS